MTKINFSSKSMTTLFSMFFGLYLFTLHVVMADPTASPTPKASASQSKAGEVHKKGRSKKKDPKTIPPTATATVTEATQTPQPTPTVKESGDKRFTLNVGSAILQPFTLSPASNSVTNTQFNLLKSSNNQGILFIQAMYRDRWAWSGDPKSAAARVLRLSDLEVGFANPSSDISAGAMIGSGALFGEMTFDMLSIPFSEKDGLTFEWSPFEWIYGGSTTALSRKLISYYGLGLSADFGLPVGGLANKIEILAAWYPSATVKEPSPSSSDPTVISGQGSFANYDEKSTSLIKFGFHYPIDDIRFLTIDATVQDQTLTLLHLPYINEHERDSNYDNWSVRIGYSQDIQSIVGSLFPKGTTPQQIAASMPTLTPTPTATPTSTPKATATSTATVTPTATP